MGVLLKILSTVIPVFAIMGAGFVYGRFRKLPGKELTDLLLWIFIPCLVLGSLGAKTILPFELLQVGGGALTILTGTGLFAFALFCRIPERRALILPSTFMNSANMAFPLALFAFGELGLTRQVIFYVVVHVLHVTLGVAIARGRGGMSEVFRLPLVYAAALAVFLVLTGTPIPKVVAEPFNLVGRATIPIMLLLLGERLGSARLKHLKLAAIAAVVRLGVGFCMGLVAVWLFDLTDYSRAAVLLGSVMPSAVFNFVLGEKYDLHPELIATTVVLTTLVSIVTSPLALYFIGVV